MSVHGLTCENHTQIVLRPGYFGFDAGVDEALDKRWVSEYTRALEHG
jgi:hypothetical protein